MTKAQTKPQNPPKKVTQAQLIQAVSDANEKGSCVKFGFILGAGASVKSNIPAGGFFAEKWFGEIADSLGENETLTEWTNSIEGFDEKNLAASYTKLFDKRFEIDYALGYQELQRYMDKAKPSIGYSFLAQVLAETENKFVITTNFDTMSEDALFDLKDAKPLVLGHEVLSSFVNAASPTRPTIIKIHRDFLFDPYNSEDKIQKMDGRWEKALNPVLRENAMIVIGYGGNDESLMGYLKAIDDRKPIYWCYRNEDELSDRILDLLTETDFLIKIESFDKFMLLLSDKLNSPRLIDQENIENSQIVKNAMARAKSYALQLEELAKGELGKNEQEAIKKLLPSWWDYQLAVKQETDSDKKDGIYREGLKAYPKSYELMINYATFLKGIYKDYDKAEMLYQEALELDPSQAISNAVYAVFLTDIRKAYDKAEEFYTQALVLKPSEGVANTAYAVFLKTIRKDYDKAENHYRNAVTDAFGHAYCSGCYAQFLLENGRRQEAGYYMEAAFKSLGEDHELALELWFYRLAHYPEFYDQAQIELGKLLAEGHQSIHWNFEGNIERAKNDGFKDIDLLERFAKDITES